MENALRSLIEKWMIKADNDLRTISNELSSKEPVTDTICYHSQQAVEKYLKLFLVSKNIEPIKTHNIAILLQKCKEFDPIFDELKGIEYLTDYAVELRYPDSFYVPEIEEAKEAFKDAKKVKKIVLELLNDNMK